MRSYCVALGHRAGRSELRLQRHSRPHHQQHLTETAWLATRAPVKKFATGSPSPYQGSTRRSTFVQRGGLSEKRKDMHRTTVELSFALLSWSAARQAHRSMASAMGTDPGEPVAVRFAVTESLVGGAHIAPHVDVLHQGARGSCRLRSNEAHSQS